MATKCQKPIKHEAGSGNVSADPEMKDADQLLAPRVDRVARL